MNATRSKIPDVQVVLVFNGEEVYDAATQPIRSVSPWIHSMQVLENNCVSLVVWAEHWDKKEDLQNVILSPLDITRAFRALVETGATHCSGYAIQDLDNSDACTSDLILQQATYGSVVWG